MHRRLGIAAALAALLVGSGVVAAGAISPAQAQQGEGFNFSQPNVVATGLAIPWGMDFLPNGTALVAERASARVLRLSPGTQPQLVTTVPNVDPDGEGGLLGLAVSPTFNSDGWVYVYHTSPSDNRIVRFQLNSPQTMQSVLTGIPRGTVIHNGGRIEFGPDGMLYAATGDAGVSSNAQNPNSLAGKILRMTPTGGIPGNNPIAGSRVYSLGHRNVQGLAWDSQARLFASEFGQNALDEVNRIVAGGNYGWPTCEGPCNPPNGNFINPLLTWPTAQSSPSGAAIAGNRLYVAALRGQRLWSIPLTAAGGVGTPTSQLVGTFGRLRSVAVSPDGWLWVATSNRDGRGNPVPADDRVVRFPPSGQTQPTSPPPTSAPPTSGPPTSPPPAGDCAISYQIQNQWPGAFQAAGTVTNTSGSAIDGWRVTWTFLDGQQISQLWGGIDTQSGAQVTVDNEAWNGNLAAGGSAAFGFIASWNNNANRAPSNLACTAS
jgi:glucose/arabinose dehydrogenase